MKKILAILMSAALLIGALSCGIVLTSAATNTSNMHFDFSYEQSFAVADTWNSATRIGINSNLFTPDGATTATVSYDTTEKALKLVGDGTNVVDLDVRNQRARTGMFVDTYTALAMKVKLSDTSAVLQSATVGLYGGNADAKPGTHYALNAVPSYAKTTDWQLIVIDLSTDNWSQTLKDFVAANTTGTKNVWWAAHLNMAQAGYTAPIYVEWVGFFMNKSSAQAHYIETTPGAEDDFREEYVDCTTSYYLDFSTEGRYNDVLNGKTGPNTVNTGAIVNVISGGKNQVNPEGSRAYDANNLAMKLDIPMGDAGQRTNWQMYDTDSTVDVATTSYMALKVRIPDASNVPAIARARVWGAGGALNEKAYINPLITKKYPAFQATTDWQLLVFELSTDTVNNLPAAIQWNKDNDASSTWYGFQIEHSAAVSYYVQWAGIFESVEDAQAHFNATPLDDELNTEGAQLRLRDNAVRFGYTMTADGVGYDGDSYNAAPLTKDSTMIIDGVERQITDFGAVLSTVSADALTAEAAAADGKKTKLVKAEKLYDVDGNKITYYVTVVNIAEANYGKSIFTRAYVAYLDDDGNTAYAYGETIERSVNGLLNAIG